MRARGPRSPMYVCVCVDVCVLLDVVLRNPSQCTPLNPRRPMWVLDPRAEADLRLHRRRHGFCMLPIMRRHQGTTDRSDSGGRAPATWGGGTGVGQAATHARIAGPVHVPDTDKVCHADTDAHAVLRDMDRKSGVRRQVLRKK